ncbi:MAG: tRNA (adenosine(37)-N6)-threonylcarbamoyltransferase complex ATPase subunit type 1 TsaE [Thiohalospira sp.]
MSAGREGVEVELADEAATLALGAELAAAAPTAALIALRGELGAGKTTLVRGLLRGLGYDGAVTSPTYTLMEPYEAGGRRVVHFDLYRLGDPEELEMLGAREELDGGALALVEWPERGEGVLPPADLVLELSHHGQGRRAGLSAGTDAGRRWLTGLDRGAVTA